MDKSDSNERKPLLSSESSEHSSSTARSRFKNAARLVVKAQAVARTGEEQFRRANPLGWRQRLSRRLDAGDVGFNLDLLTAVLALCYASLYVANTYIEGYQELDSIWIAELVCATYFLFNFVIRGYLLSDPPKWKFFLELTSIIDIIVIIPVVPWSFFVSYHTLWFGNGYLRLVFPARFIKLFFSVDVFLSRKREGVTLATQLAMRTYFMILCIALTAAGVIQIAETGTESGGNPDQWNFHNSLFYTILIFGTIGYPEDNSALARLFIGGLAIVLVIIVPYKISQFIDLATSTSSYAQIAYKNPSPNHCTHVILSGDLDTQTLREFFREFFHDVHQDFSLRVVIIHHKDPCSDVKLLLQDPFFSKRVKYLTGSVLLKSDLHRADAENADACFILSKHSRGISQYSQVADNDTILRSLAIHTFAPNLRLFVQLNFPENKNLAKHAKQVLCLEQFRLAFLAKNCVNIGFSTFVYHITNSYAGKSNDPSQLQSFNHNQTQDGDLEWITQYLDGAANEIYPIMLPGTLQGTTFQQASLAIYNESHGKVVLFAVDTRLRSERSGGMLLLNPRDYVVRGGETGFVIAKDRAEADQVQHIPKQTNLPPLKHSQKESKQELSQQKNKSSAKSSYEFSDLSESEFVPVDHLLVCATGSDAWLPRMEYFLGPLRSSGFTNPVVFLHSVKPTIEQWSSIEGFDSIYFLQGNPMQAIDLEKAGLMSVKKIVILSGSEHNYDQTDSSESREPLLFDSTAVAIFQKIRNLHPTLKITDIIIDLMYKHNMEFIYPRNTELQDDAIDLLVGFKGARDHYSSLTAPSFAAGIAYSGTLLESLVCNLYFNPYTVRLLEMLTFTTENDESLSSSVFSQIPVPKKLVGSTYSRLFETLLVERGCIALGLYRQPQKLTSINFQINKPEFQNLGFVYTCPPATAIIADTDFIFVLQ